MTVEMFRKVPSHTYQKQCIGNYTKTTILIYLKF